MMWFVMLKNVKVSTLLMLKNVIKPILLMLKNVIFQLCSSWLIS